jgi:hypothetical protein
MWQCGGILSLMFALLVDIVSVHSLEVNWRKHNHRTKNGVAAVAAVVALIESMTNSVLYNCSLYFIYALGIGIGIEI